MRTTTTIHTLLTPHTHTTTTSHSLPPHTTTTHSLPPHTHSSYNKENCGDYETDRISGEFTLSQQFISEDCVWTFRTASDKALTISFGDGNCTDILLNILHVRMHRPTSYPIQISLVMH